MADNTNYISVTFQYPIPDEYRSTSFEDGNTGTFTYYGPEFLTFEIDKVTGKESGWCIWEEQDLERPVAEDEIRVTVDCKEQPLLCEIANDSGSNEQVAFRRTRNYGPIFVAPEGYVDVDKPLEYEPRDIYDEFNISYDFDEEEFLMPVKDWASQGVNMDLTWDEIREIRDQELNNTDGKIAPDAPDSVRNAWTTYRQKLRDLPSVMQAAGYEPWQVGMMFPMAPADMKDPEQDPNEIT